MRQASIIPLLKFADSALPFKVQTIRSFAEEHDEVCEHPHSHNYYEMIWMIRGKSVLQVDMQQYPIEDNMIFCLKPNQAHQFGINDQMEGFVFSFTDRFLDTNEFEFDWTFQATLFQIFSDPVMSIRQDIEPGMKEITQGMVNESENQYSFKAQLLKRYFRIFLIYLARQLEKSEKITDQTRETDHVKSFMELLDRQFKEKKMVAEYATQLSVTPNYLNRVIKKNIGVSAGHCIRQRVVLEAKRLGRYSNAGMKAIAYDLGFADSAHFSRFFKSVAGTNFSDFKKSGVVLSLTESLNRA